MSWELPRVGLCTIVCVHILLLTESAAGRWITCLRVVVVMGVWECECLPAPSSALAGQVELAALKAYGDFKSRTKLTMIGITGFGELFDFDLLFSVPITVYEVT